MTQTIRSFWIETAAELAAITACFAGTTAMLVYIAAQVAAKVN